MITLSKDGAYDKIYSDKITSSYSNYPGKFPKNGHRRMRSMTGYGYSEFQNEKMSIALEIKSYNSRFLELYVYVPSFLSSLEPLLRGYINERIERGKVELSVRIKELEEDAVISIDKNIAMAGYSALAQLAELTAIDEPVTISDLLKVDGVIKKVRNKDTDYFWEAIKPVFEKAYGQFDASTREEGCRCEADILKQVEIISSSTKIIENYAAGIEEDIKKNLRERFQQMLGSGADESRIYAETAVMLMKLSINEEIVRMKHHVESFLKEAGSGNPQIGKKLDFICQEINREINTIGSKNSKVEVSQAVVDTKDALEKIREQIRNVV
ncbi:MAG: YicC family protein [Spirochaetes bacterium]|nr:YicC family protein [Spirochaetota bacterium]